jgi:ribosomal protein S18 acetylase RimI-like enzyme
MKQFETYEEYVEITKKHRKGSDYKNVYFLRDQVNALINAGKLSYKECGLNLYIFEKCDGFSRFYFYICKDETPEVLRFEEPLVVEFVYEAPSDEKHAETVEYLGRLGFELGRRSIRMSLQSLSDFRFDEDRCCSSRDILLGPAEIKDAEDIRSMLLAEFDPKYSFIPAADEMEEIIREGRIVVARHNDEIAGFEHFEITRKVLKCWHMLVAEAYQGQGIAWSLFSESHRISMDRADSGQVWLREDNGPAVRLYRSGGYEPDNRRSDEYILRDDR